MNDVEYRELPEEREEEFDRLVRYAFRPQAGPGAGSGGDADEGTEEDEGPDVGEEHGMFDGDDLLAVCRQIYWTSTVRGGSVRLAGLSAVASPPESRRKGVVARMVAESIEEYHDRDCPFAALWPFRRSFYARYGYGTANCYVHLEAPVETLSFADGDGGEFRPVEADDWGSLDRVYRRHAAGHGLAIERDEQWWRRHLFQSWETDPYVYAVDRDGTVVGYVVYTVEERDDGRAFRARDLAWTDREAFRDLLRFCFYHDSQVDTVELYGRPGGGLRDLLDSIPSPGEEGVEYHLRPGPMVRIVDVASALETIPYPTDLDESVVISVSDPVTDRNDGTFVLDVSDGRGTCTPAGGGTPEVSASIGALSQAAVGYRPVDRLRRIADLDGDDAALDRMASLFPEDDVFLRDFF